VVVDLSSRPAAAAARRTLTAGGPSRSSDFIPTYNIDGWSDTREQVLLRRDQRLGVDKKQAVLKMLAEVRVAAAPAERALCCVRPNVFKGGGTVCNGLDPAAQSHARGRLRALRGAAVVLCTAPPRAGAAWEGHRARGLVNFLCHKLFSVGRRGSRCTRSPRSNPA
jgi:hypothetical protein